MIDKRAAFTVRRARLLLGATRTEFAAIYGVDEATVSRWERGIDQPKPETWARLRTITLKASSALDVDLVRASPLYKFLVDMKDLTHPIVTSKGVIEALKAVGASELEDKPFYITEPTRKSPLYEISSIRALETIQADPHWLGGDIVYAEVHCIVATFGDIWVDAMIAPLPDRLAALIEFAPSRRGTEDGFRVHPIHLQDMPFNRPRSYPIET